MNVVPKSRLTVDEFLAWASGEEERYELADGVVHAMAPESAGHATIKFAVQSALAAAIRARGLPCHMLPDGMTVRIEANTAYEPDALVYCGAELAMSAREVPEPVVVVEVLSPNARRIDLAAKLVDYFRLPSVMHYLIVDPARRVVVHHARGADDLILTRIASTGTIKLDPPGLQLDLPAIYA